MGEFALKLISDYGYFGMFVGMVLEAVIIVIPSEAILATGGILASRNIFSFWNAFLVGLLGSVFCAIVIYFMGYFGGRPFIKRYGKYFFMKDEDIEKSDEWFSKYGLFASCIGRNFPIVRTLISLPVGISRISFFKFLIYTTIGSIPWTFVFVYVGYALGNNWVVAKEYVSRIKVPIQLILVALVIIFICRRVVKN